MSLASALANGMHLLMVFFPALVFLLPAKLSVPWYKYVFLALILIPLHWPLCDNKCFLTLASIKMGWLEDTGGDSAFSETYLRWLYEPFLSAVGLPWTAENVDKAVYAHWMVNFVLLWYYLCFVAQKQLFC